MLENANRKSRYTQTFKIVHLEKERQPQENNLLLPIQRPGSQCKAFKQAYWRPKNELHQIAHQHPQPNNLLYLEHSFGVQPGNHLRAALGPLGLLCAELSDSWGAEHFLPVADYFLGSVEAD